MDNLRELVYEDKASLSDFDANISGTINNRIYTEWLLNRQEIDPFDAKHRLYYLKAFNDAYYLCTLAILLPNDKKLLPNQLINRVERPSIVFPMVCFYLSLLIEKSTGINHFLTQMEGVFKARKDWKQNYEELKETAKGHENNIDSSLFAHRKLTKDILNSIDWCILTNYFRKDKIENIVKNIARSKEVWLMMIEAIKAAAQKYDYDFGFEDYTEEDIDEDGPYTRTITIPKNPYDNYGNEILEPLKRAGVYHFCDELMEKYDELMVKSWKQTFPNTIATSKPNPSNQRGEEDNPIFRENLDPEAIVLAIQELKNNYVISLKIGERNFLKFVRDAFIQLGWLNANKQKSFIIWAQNRKIMGAKTQDFKHLGNYHNDEMFNSIINKFSEIQQNGKFLDRDEFYRLDPQGIRLRKYNNG